MILPAFQLACYSLCTRAPDGLLACLYPWWYACVARACLLIHNGAVKKLIILSMLACLCLRLLLIPLEFEFVATMYLPFKECHKTVSIVFLIFDI